ncbi:hypothetical protein [Marinobacter caseinilyticus]|uniref:hypothetical protein n=1 Tax=Marinobacter caseinilyticus TaxID=2692195 RepID=UPI00140968C7|nr:hypothetical protein [Marinobacter caseinilyticus]
MPKSKLKSHSNWFITTLLLACPVNASSQTGLLCTITADQYPGFENGLMESTTVRLTGMQGEAGGQATVYETDTFRFRVITGRTQIHSGTTKLMDFYVEAQNIESGHSIRAASASFAGGPHQARLELVNYPTNTDWYEGIAIFECAEATAL